MTEKEGEEKKVTRKTTAKQTKGIEQTKETKAKAEKRPKAQADKAVKAESAKKPVSKSSIKETKRAHRKVRVGQVVSNKMDKTAVVAVESQFRHPLYKKIMKRTKKFVVHDEQNQTSIGDLVEIMETRPLSRLKRWRLVNIVEKSK